MVRKARLRNLTLSTPQIKAYSAQLTVNTPIGPVSNISGYGYIDVTVHGPESQDHVNVHGGDFHDQIFRFVTSHFAVPVFFDSTIQQMQAEELIASALNTPHPIVFVCDCNSSANDLLNGTFLTYDQFIDAGFIDTWPEIHPFDPGYTCCQAIDLKNPKSLLSLRIDYIWSKGFDIDYASLVGDKPLNRTYPVRWDSDHAGVFARLRLPNHSSED